MVINHSDKWYHPLAVEDSMKILTTFALLSAVFAASANAATVTEFTAGDFGDEVETAYDLGTLDEGSNSISGFLYGGFDETDTLDLVRFTIAEGFELYDAGVTSFGLGFGVTYGAGIMTPDWEPIIGDEYDIGNGGSFSYGEVLGAGTYVFAIEAFPPRGEFFDISYDAYGLVRATDPVSEVPLPASAPLALAGC